MSAKPKGGGPAFPIPIFPGEGWDSEKDGSPNGIDLRDWFAAQEEVGPSTDYGWALLEAIAGPRPTESSAADPLVWFEWENKWRAAIKYARADAMLAARDGKEGA